MHFCGTARMCSAYKRMLMKYENIQLLTERLSWYKGLNFIVIRYAWIFGSE